MDPFFNLILESFQSKVRLSILEIKQVFGGDIM